MSDSAHVLSPETGPHDSGTRIFAAGGESGAMLAAIDWASTSLGPVETWPQALRTSVRICLSSRHPIILWVGPDLIFFHNDAYAPTLGIKRSWAAGRPGRVVWPEIWDMIGPMLEGVLQTGEPTWSDNQLLFLERSGYPEETYHTFSYSPIEDENGAVIGVFTAVTETTQRVLSERRTLLARDLASALVDARSTQEVCLYAASVLATDPADIPFALLYGTDACSQRATLLGAAGLAQGTPLSPAIVHLDTLHENGSRKRDDVDHWSLGQVVRQGHEILARNIVWGEATCADDGGCVPCDALVLPVLEPGQTEPAAVLVAGISPQRKLDAEYHAFYRLIADHLATALAAAYAYEVERKRAEALAEIDRAKTKFFSNVSHEFRTPLTLVLGPLEESLADPEVTSYPRQRERLELMRRNGMRLLKLVNALLDFARIEAGRVRAIYTPTDLATATAELASAFESVTEQAGLALIVDCPPLTDLPAPVYVDREMWEKIVLNLLSNAFKFTFTGSITVALRALEDASGKIATVELMVRDTGSGIPEAEQAYVFERFHRVEGARARTHEGSGIGLALVQELVHLHGGTIHVESTEGVGTTFFVRLPIGADHLPGDQIATGEPAVTLTSPAVGALAYVEEARRWLPNESASHQVEGDNVSLLALDDAVLPTGAPGVATDRARILVADDSADMREYLSRLLRERFSVTMVANGVQALAAIQRGPEARPDLVLADVMMPELDGFGLLRAIRSNPATVTLPVILLSARAGEEATVEGLQAGADDYLVKPFSAREVVSRIEARLEISRARADSERRTRRALDAILHVAQTLFNPPDFLAFDILPDVTQRSMSLPEDAEHVVAHRLAMLMCDVMGCRRVSITAVHPETEVLRAVAVVGLTAEQEQQWWDEQRERERSSVRLGDGANPDELTRFRAGEVFVLDMTQPPLNAEPNPYKVTTSLVAPMRAGDRLVGILSLDFGGPPHIFSDDERALSEAVAQLGAVALEREHLLRVSSEAKARELAAVDARRQMDEFLGIATHELRTPLTSVTANIRMSLRLLTSLSRALPDEDAVVTEADDLRGLPNLLKRCSTLLERTDRQMLRLNRLVGDLVDVSRIQAGKLELRPESCDLLTIVREAVHEQRASWPHRTVALTIPRRAAITISADSDRIGQVVTNLLTNALKYSPDVAEVIVSVRTLGDGVRVEVRDQGPGISAAYQAHLWERFYRVPGIEQQSGSGVGLGLGLNICRTIVERHGGQVGVESAPGKGSTFWFSLPLA